MANVFLTGSGWFGQEAAEAAEAAGHRVTGVAAPRDGRRGGRDLLSLWAERRGLTAVESRSLAEADVPDGCDVILAAHSHAMVGPRTRARARYALGYHPSLLPLHRGRDAVRWQARMGERAVGGSIYHLTDRVDGGPLAAQRTVIVPPALDASSLWRDYLAPLGLEMIASVLDDVARDAVAYRPQDDKLATWEPSFASAPLYRPELLELTSGNGK